MPSQVLHPVSDPKGRYELHSFGEPGRGPHAAEDQTLAPVEFAKAQQARGILGRGTHLGFNGDTAFVDDKIHLAFVGGAPKSEALEVKALSELAEHGIFEAGALKFGEGMETRQVEHSRILKIDLGHFGELGAQLAMEGLEPPDDVGLLEQEEVLLDRLAGHPQRSRELACLEQISGLRREDFDESLEAVGIANLAELPDIRQDIGCDDLADLACLERLQ